MKPIRHIFYESQFNNEFGTMNAILNRIPYSPKIMFLGTFNPNSPKTNFADFFYGRNYFWPAIHNLFYYKKIELLTSRMPKRMPKNGKPRKPIEPTLDIILNHCKELKFTFADLIMEVLHKNDPQYHVLDNDNICYDGATYNLVQDGRKGQVYGLEQLDSKGQVNWNTDNIAEYLNNNHSIRIIYFTRQPTKIWAKQWEKLKRRLPDRTFVNIFTPSGQGDPVLNSMPRLLSHWLHNTNASKFGRLDNEWLLENGVKIVDF